MVRNGDIRHHYIVVACRLQPCSDTAIGHTEDSLIAILALPSAVTTVAAALRLLNKPKLSVN